MVQLTRVERAVARRVSEAWLNREIATERKTSEQVIKNVLHRIYEKTGMGNKLELALAVVAHPEWIEEPSEHTPQLSRADIRRIARIALDVEQARARRAGQI